MVVKKKKTKKNDRPMNLIVFGPPGVGKTDFAANFPLCRFIIDSKEDGIKDLVAYGRCPEPVGITTVKTWTKLRDVTQGLASDPEGCETVVYDSTTGFETICFRHHCKTYFDGDWSKEGFFAYQQGPKNAAKTDWPDFLDDVSALNRAGLNTVMIAHAQVKPYQNPDGPDYDRYTPYLDKETWAQTHRWAQTILFYNYSPEFEKKGSSKTKQKAKAGSDTRYLHTVWQPGFDAKNRFGLPPVIEAGESGEEAYTNFMEALVACQK